MITKLPNMLSFLLWYTAGDGGPLLAGLDPQLPPDRIGPVGEDFQSHTTSCFSFLQLKPNAIVLNLYRYHIMVMVEAYKNVACIGMMEGIAQCLLDDAIEVECLFLAVDIEIFLYLQLHLDPNRICSLFHQLRHCHDDAILFQVRR